MKPFIAAAFAAASFTLVLAGSAVAQEPIKIGVTQPLTGAFAASGNYVAQPATIAAAATNAHGGGRGRKIQLASEDDHSTPTEAAATAAQLIPHPKLPARRGA